MTRLLIFEPSWRRIRTQLLDLPPHEIVLLHEDGSLTDGAYSAQSEQPAFDAAWLNSDVWLSAQSERFMGLTLTSPSLKWVQSVTAGTDMPIFRQFEAKNICVVTSHVQSIAIAEFVLTRVLSYFQDERARPLAQAQREWKPKKFREIAGSRWLIVGFGAIGQDIAVRVNAFGGSVVGVRQNVAPHPLAERIIGLSDISAELPSTDVLVLCVPLSPQTEGLIGAEKLRQMKADAVLVNVGRGQLLDEDALMAALAMGTIEHAILDVYATEPVPPDSALWDQAKIWMTPHTSSFGSGHSDRHDALFLKNFKTLISEV